MTAARKLIVLAAGGTGGHIFPAQALAEEMLKRGYTLALITDRRGEGYGDALGRVDTYRISVVRVDSGGGGRARGLALLAIGLVQARRLLRKLAPGAVVGFGGYPSVPTMVAATRARRATLIHEQNAVLGRANRLVARRVTRIATSFPSVTGIRPADMAKVVLTGNPVRAGITALRDHPYPPFGHGEKALRILVIGGSQGARILSEVVPAAVSLLPDRMRRRLAIAQQCRPEDVETARAGYASCGVDAELATFFDDVPRRLADTHLVICRAGASTVAELTEAGRPAILVPYPLATDDHQRANGRAIEECGGAWLMPQDAFTPESLAVRLETLLTMPETLAHAAAAAKRSGRPDAAARLADAVVDLVMSGDGGAARAGAGQPREEAA